MTSIDFMAVVICGTVALVLWTQVTAADHYMKRKQRQREEREAAKYGVHL